MPVFGTTHVPGVGFITLSTQNGLGPGTNRSYIGSTITIRLTAVIEIFGPEYGLGG